MKGDGRDPRPMLAIFAVLVVAALGSAVSSIRLDHLLASAASLAPYALGAVAIALALAPQRFLATRRALAARATIAVIPADEFDPKPETVLRFSAELARADRSLRGWLDRRAQALRVQADQRSRGSPRLPARSPRPLARAAAHGAARLRRSGAAGGDRRAAPGQAGARQDGQAPNRADPGPRQRRAIGPPGPRPRSLAAFRSGDGFAATEARRARHRLRRPAAERRYAPLAAAAPPETGGAAAAWPGAQLHGSAQQRTAQRTRRSRRAVRAPPRRRGTQYEAAGFRAAV